MKIQRFVLRGLALMAAWPYMTIASPADTERGVPQPRYVASPAQNRDEVLDFWTEQRMTEAEFSIPGPAPIPGQTLLPGADTFGYVAMEVPYAAHRTSRLTGILFYRQPDGALAHCSASVLTSSSKSLILTAAHCVNLAGEWKQMMMFVPAYRGTAPNSGERSPFGRWPISQAFIPRENAGNDPDDDVAVARLFPDERLGLIQNAVDGGFEPWISETELPATAWTVGYPGSGQSHYGKGIQFHCYTFVRPNDSGQFQGSSRISTPNCGTVSGSSGGPLLWDQPDGTWKVIGEVYDTTSHTRLKPETFGEIYPAADNATPPSP